MVQNEEEEGNFEALLMNFYRIFFEEDQNH